MIQLYDFQENEFEENKENRKRKTLDLNESLESEAFIDVLEEAVKSKKIKRKKDAKKTFYYELLEIQKQQLKLFEESEKRFQTFHGKPAAERGCRKTKGQKVFFTISQNVRTG